MLCRLRLRLAAVQQRGLDFPDRQARLLWLQQQLERKKRPRPTAPTMAPEASGAPAQKILNKPVLKHAGKEEEECKAAQRRFRAEAPRSPPCRSEDCFLSI